MLFKITKPQPSHLIKYERIELTSMMEYAPQFWYLRWVAVTWKLNMVEWRARIDYPSCEVVRSTLDHTTHMITTLQAGTREHMRDNYKTRAWAFRSKRIDYVMYYIHSLLQYAPSEVTNTSKCLHKSILNLKKYLLCIVRLIPLNHIIILLDL